MATKQNNIIISLYLCLDYEMYAPFRYYYIFFRYNKNKKIFSRFRHTLAIASGDIVGVG